MPVSTDHVRQLKGLLLALGILVFGGVIIMFSLHRQETLSGRQGETAPESDATYSMTGIHHTDIRQGVKAWKREWLLDAESGEYRPEDDMADLKMLDATFFNSDGEPVFLSADSGVLKTDSNDLEVTGNVVLKNSQNEMQTDRLIYNEKKGIFATESPVTVKFGALSLTKKYNSMTYSLDTGDTTLDRNEEVPF